MQTVKAVAARKRIAKLVQEFVRGEDRLVRLAFKLKAFSDLRQEVRTAYLNATIKSPEAAADDIWTLCVDGDERAESFDAILLNLPYEAKQYHVADAILEFCAEKGWTDQVQAVLNSDAQELLAERKARNNVLLSFADQNFADQVDAIDWSRPSDGTHEDLLKLLNANEGTKAA